MRLELKRNLPSHVYDLYADSGIAPGTEVQVQNQSRHDVRIYAGLAPPSDRTHYFILYPDQKRRFKAASLTAWTEGFKSDVVVDLPDTPAAVSAAVTSVNGIAGPGNVDITTDDIPEGAANLYFTDQRAIDAAIDDAATSSSTGWSSQKINQELHPDDDVESVTGTAVDVTDPRNPKIDLQTALQTAVTDVANNFVGSDVETILAELKLLVSGVAHTVITGIDLQPTSVPNQFTIAVTWTDGDGASQTTTDPTPISIVDGQLTAQLIEAGPNSTAEAPTIVIKNTVGGVDVLSNEYPLPFSPLTATSYETLSAATSGSIAVERDAPVFMQRFVLTGYALLAPTMEVGDTLLGAAYLNGFNLSMPAGTVFLRGEFTDGYVNNFQLRKVADNIYTVEVYLTSILVETLVFSHNLSVGGVFTSNTEVNSVNTAGKFSILDTLEDFRLPEGNFRFRLKYPDTNVDILFEQDTNPVTGPVGATTGLNIIEGTGYGSSFKGMALSESGRATYDGMLGSNSWWYPIGVYATHLGGVPASDSPSTIAQLTEFYAFKSSL